MKSTIRLIKFITLALVLFVTVGSLAWARLNLPYVGNLADVTLKRVHRIDFRTGDDTLAQIYDVQITCQQPAARQLSCQHELANNQLTVDVQLQDSIRSIGYDCQARYGNVAVPCQAYDTLYTGGGLTTPVVIIKEGMPLTNAELSSLGWRYQWYSPLNIELWLTYSYFALIPLLTLVFAGWLWQKLGVSSDQGNWWRTAVTTLATVPVGIVVLFSTIFLMLSLYLVD